MKIDLRLEVRPPQPVGELRVTSSARSRTPAMPDDQGQPRTGDDAPHEALPGDLRRAHARAPWIGHHRDCRWALVLHRRTTFDIARASVYTVALGQ
jgi:hypothetical protein